MARADIDELKIVIEADDKVTDKLDSVLTKLEDLGNIKIENDALKEVTEEAERTATKIDEVVNSFGKMDAIKLSNSLSKLQLYNRQLDEAYEKLARLMNNKDATPEQITSQIAKIQSLKDKIAKATAEQDRWNRSVKQTSPKLDALDRAVKKAGDSFSKFGKRVGKSASQMFLFPFAQVAKGAHKLTGALGKLFTKLKTVVMYRVLRGFIKMINEGFKEGTQNAYEWSRALGEASDMGRYASTLDSLASSALYLKNAFGAVAIPILNALEPAITSLIAKVVDAINVINRLFATLTGASTWTKALYYPKQFSDALDNATGRAKELKDAITILGIDEINPLNAVNEPSSGSGGSADALDYSSMFEEVALTAENVFSDMFDPLEKAWKNKGESVLKSIENMFTNIKTLGSSLTASFSIVWKNGTGQKTIETILQIFTNIFDTIGNIAKALDKGWNTDNLGTDIIQNIWNSLNTILEMWEKITGATAEWAKGIDFAPLLNGIKKVTDAFNRLLEPITDTLAHAWNNILLPFASWVTQSAAPVALELIANALGAIAEAWKLVSPALSWLWDNILSPTLGAVGGWVLDALQGLSDFLESIKNLLQDINNLLNGNKSLKEFLESRAFKPTETQFNQREDWQTPGQIPKVETSTDRLSDYLFEGKGTMHVDVIGDKYVQDFNDPFTDTTAIATEMEDKVPRGKGIIADVLAKANALDTIGIPAGKKVVGGVTGNISTVSNQVPSDKRYLLGLTGGVSAVANKLTPQKSVIEGMTANLTKKNETFSKTTGVMTALLSKKNETFSKITSAMTALLSKKSETFGKTTGVMTASLAKKSETFSKTTGGMTALLSAKSETFGKTTSGMTANLAYKKEAFSTITGGMTAYLTGRTDAIPNADRWITGVTAYIKSLAKASGFSGITLSGNVTASTSGSRSNVAVALKEQGGVFSHGFWKKIPQYASGTLNAGSMFIAGENGAEIVGNINGKTEVLNQSQIAQAMASSMMQANAGQNALLQEQNALLRQLLEKDATVTAILSTSSLADGVARKNRREGRTVIPVGV